MSISRLSPAIVGAISPPSIQRAETGPIESGSASVEPPVAVGSESRDREGTDDKTDVDELARRVYQDIKRRLAREWERARGLD